MASAWISPRATKGGRRFRVMYRVGGRESVPRYGGSFKTKREALARQGWITGELAAMRVPDLKALALARARTLSEACEHWRAARVDVAEGTRVLHRVALGRVLPLLGEKSVDALTVDDVNELVTALDASGRKRETIRKSVKYLAAVLEEGGIEPNRPGRRRSACRMSRPSSSILRPPST